MQATAIEITSTSAGNAQELYVYATSQVVAGHKKCGDNDVGDYVADEKAIQSGTAHHDADFKAVCMSAQSAAKQMLAGNHVFYEHIAKLTTWFPTVEGTPYLDTLIKDKTKKAYKKKVSYGINFVPVIDAVWSGIDRTDLPVNKTNRISRVLNVLYKVYREKFNSDPNKEAELVNTLLKAVGSVDLSATTLKKVSVPMTFQTLVRIRKISRRHGNWLSRLYQQPTKTASIFSAMKTICPRPPLAQTLHSMRTISHWCWSSAVRTVHILLSIVNRPGFRGGWLV